MSSATAGGDRPHLLGTWLRGVRDGSRQAVRGTIIYPVSVRKEGDEDNTGSDPLCEAAVLGEGHDDLVCERDDGAVGGYAIDNTGRLFGPCGEGGFQHSVHSDERCWVSEVSIFSDVEELRLNLDRMSWQSL